MESQSVHCISLVTRDGEHFFKCFSAIRDSSHEDSLALCPLFLIGLFDLFVSNFLSFWSIFWVLVL